MLVFVYGTLTDPARVDGVLEEGPGTYEFVDRATVEGLRRVDGRYPTLVPGGSVDGRLLAVDEAALERLDRYEGVDRGLYVRVPVPLADSHAAADESVQLYVGDPIRLGVEIDTAWSADESLREAVRSYVLSNQIVVQSRE